MRWRKPEIEDAEYIVQCNYRNCKNSIIACNPEYVIDVAKKEGWKVDEDSGYIFCPKCIPKIEKRKTEIKKREEEIIKGNEELERRFKQLEKGIKNEK
jgi:hypothetical protein